jgi:hypothetical protein
MRIVLLTQWFEPERSFKAFVLAREPDARDYDRTVLTSIRLTQAKCIAITIDSAGCRAG